MVQVKRHGRRKVAEMGEHQKSGERVKISVGGTVFETTVSTLTRVNNTVLSTMVAEHWRNQEELFVDRSPTYFSKILDYLRDGENVTLPKEDEAREALRKEAEFYNLPGLSRMCAPDASASKDDKGLVVNSFCKGDIVQWKESAIEIYWKYLVRHLFELEYPIFVKGRPRCLACGDVVDNYIGPTVIARKVDNEHINYEKFALLKHHMSYMTGIVQERFGMTCCEIKWNNNVCTHVPVSALRFANST